jgi:hypothetical protein
LQSTTPPPLDEAVVVPLELDPLALVVLVPELVPLVELAPLVELGPPVEVVPAPELEVVVVAPVPAPPREDPLELVVPPVAVEEGSLPPQ